MQFHCLSSYATAGQEKFVYHTADLLGTVDPEIDPNLSSSVRVNSYRMTLGESERPTAKQRW